MISLNEIKWEHLDPISFNEIVHVVKKINCKGIKGNGEISM